VEKEKKGFAAGEAFSSFARLFRTPNAERRIANAFC